MDEKPMVSIVVLTYYHENYLDAALKSILSQKTQYQYEIVISDDFSGDNTVAVIEKYYNKYPDKIVPIFNKENLGIPRNLYQAFCKCRGKYITILSGDDFWIDDKKLQRQVKFLEKYRQYIAAATAIEGRLDGRNACMEIPPRKYWGKEVTLEMFMKGRPLPSHSFMMRNMFTQEEGRKWFSEIVKASRYIDDAALCILLLKKSPVYVMGFVSYAYRIAAPQENHSYNSRNSALQKAFHELEMYRYLYEHVKGVNYFHMYAEWSGIGVLACLMERRPQEIRRIAALLPKEYRKPSFYFHAFVCAGKTGYASLGRMVQRKVMLLRSHSR